MPIYDMIHCITVPLYIISVYYLFNTLFSESKSKKIEILSYLVFGILQMLFYFFSTVPMLTFSFTLMFYFTVSLNYKSKIIKRILNVFYVLFITLTLETVLVLLSLNIHTNLFIDSEVESPIVIVVIRVVTLTVSYLLHRFTHNLKKEYKIPIYHYVFHFILLIGLLFLYLTSINNSSLTVTNILINSCVLIIVVIIIVLNDEKIYNSLLVHTERNVLRKQNLFYENQNKIIDQSDKNIKSIKHDIKNHLISLKSICSNDKNPKAIEYINSLLTNIEVDNSFVHSGNFVIDSILNFKLHEVKSLNINLNIDVKIPTEINISAYSLTVILGNLIDNSIEALKNTSTTRNLDIIINIQKGNLTILIENTYNGKIKIKNGILHTTKALQSMHGFGLENIKTVLANSNGMINIDYTDKIFSVVVIIPNTN